MIGGDFNELMRRREEYGVSKTKLALEADMSPRHLRRLELGEVNLTEKMAKQISDALDRLNPDSKLSMLIDYVRIRFITTDVRHIIKNILKLSEKYMIHEEWGRYGYEEHYEIENSVTHLYVWGTKEECTILEKGVTTGTLFDTVTMANVVEDQGLEETSPEIVINAYGIQTTDLDGGKTSAQEVWTILSSQMPTTDVEEQEDPNTDVKDSNRNSGNGAEENTGEEEQAETPGTEPDAAEKPGTEDTKPETSKPEKQ